MRVRALAVLTAVVAGGLLTYLVYPAVEPTGLQIVQSSSAYPSVDDPQFAGQGISPPPLGTEQFGSWTVACGASDSRTQTCRMAQKAVLIGENGATNQFITISLRRNDGADDLAGIVMVPLGFELPAGATLMLNDVGSISADIRTCVPQGCLLTFTLPDQVLDSLGRLQTLALVLKKLDEASRIAIEISSTGFMEARSRLISGGS